MKWRSGALKWVCAAHAKPRRATTIDAGTGHEITGPDEQRAAARAGGDPTRLTVRSRQCSRFLQQEVAAALPAICESLLEKAKSGDVACARALWQMAAFNQKHFATSRRQPANAGLAFARKVLAEFEAE